VFTGIIEEIGVIRAIRRSGSSGQATIGAAEVLSDLKPGDSVAVSGSCVTAVRVMRSAFTCDLSAETLSRTTLGQAATGRKVNLERAALPTTRMGGHLVLGHVDGVGRVADIRRVDDGLEITVEAPDDVARYLTEKGSVAVDGVSLTPFRVAGSVFTVALIPTTLGETTLGFATRGDPVNVEADVMAKYAESGGGHVEDSSGGKPSGVTLDLLRRSGFAD
jgi:riboflavin synthase